MSVVASGSWRGERGVNIKCNTQCGERASNALPGGHSEAETCLTRLEGELYTHLFEKARKSVYMGAETVVDGPAHKKSKREKEENTDHLAMEVIGLMRSASDIASKNLRKNSTNTRAREQDENSFLLNSLLTTSMTGTMTTQ